MSRTTIGAVILLVANLLLGFLTGRFFFSLFLQNMPPLALSSFSEGASQAAFVTCGLGLGVVLFGWCILIVLVSRFFVKRPATPAK